MGNKQSNSMRTHTEVLNETLMEVVNRSRATASQQCRTNQTVKVIIGPTAKVEGDLKITQVAAVLCNLTGNIAQSMGSEMANSIEIQLENMIKQANSSEQDFLSTAISSQEGSTTVEQYIKNVFRTSLTNVQESACSQYLDMTQTAEVELYGIVRAIDITQDIQATAIASCLMENIAKTLTENKGFERAYNDLESKNESTQKGVGDLLGQFKWVFLIIAIVIVAAIFLFALMKFSGPSKKK